MISRFFQIFQKEKVIGSLRGGRRYDLPLNSGSGTGFLRLLVALMTVLAVLAVSATFVLSGMKDRWTSGLENKASIEIPAQSPEGRVRDRESVAYLTQKIVEILKSSPSIMDIRVMSEKEIAALVSPWLGDDLATDVIPMPGLIAISFDPRIDNNTDALQDRLHKVAPDIRLDTHESWLADVLSFAGALQLTALIVTLVIGATTVAAIAGAVRSRIAIHREELELLHLMGASDSYVTRQFQRHTLIVALQGAVIGLLSAGLLILIISWMSGEMNAAFLPDFRMSGLQKTAIFLSPLMVALIAVITARQTVLRSLRQMP